MLTTNALGRQEGGSHYQNFAIQPVEFIIRNNLGFLEGCVIKRVCRWKAKDGLQDLRKAIHELELLIEQEENRQKTQAMAAGAIGRLEASIAGSISSSIAGGGSAFTKAADSVSLQTAAAYAPKLKDGDYGYGVPTGTLVR